MLTLTPRARALVKKPLGSLYTRLPARKRGFLITVGDDVSARFIRKGIIPDVIVYDGKVRRMPAESDFNKLIKGVKKRVILAVNPAGCITDGAWNAMLRSIKLRAKLRVVGEEDLLTLAAIAQAPAGAAVWYGQPGVGAVRVDVNYKSRALAAKVLAMMKR
ncbi:DUF359 domain-containing protein [Candidatus Micrarchaeota archaeon]|nr:DUF359 domain-containing protein [Candidatus Micrarchaeota archaeon]